jgi:hypothetical protein
MAVDSNKQQLAQCEATPIYYEMLFMSLTTEARPNGDQFN